MIYLILLFLLVATPLSAQTISSITWTNSATGASGVTSGVLPDWNISSPPITLQVGNNNICVVYNTAYGRAQDCILVTYQPTFPGAALVGAWGFEDGSGTTTVDSSGNSNTGYLTNGPAWWPNGKYGKALQFDGTNDYVLVQDSNSLDLTQSFTISAWVFPTAVYTNWRAILVKNYIQFLYATNGGFGECTSGTVLGGFISGGVVDEVCEGPGNALPTGQWTHLAVSYDNATAQLSLYRNGVEVTGSPVTVSGLMTPTAESLQIGGSKYDENFGGLIDEVRFYNIKIPRTTALNTTPGAACGYTSQADRTDMTKVSVVGDMNCPVVATIIATPLPIKFAASPTGLKLKAAAAGAKFGQVP